MTQSEMNPSQSFLTSSVAMDLVQSGATQKLAAAFADQMGIRLRRPNGSLVQQAPELNQRSLFDYNNSTMLPATALNHIAQHKRMLFQSGQVILSTISDIHDVARNDNDSIAIESIRSGLEKALVDTRGALTVPDDWAAFIATGEIEMINTQCPGTQYTFESHREDILPVLEQLNEVGLRNNEDGDRCTSVCPAMEGIQAMLAGQEEARSATVDPV